MRVGIVGCGKVALDGHIPAFEHLGSEIVGVADSNKIALKKVRAKKKYTDYTELLKQNLDIVSICAPPFLHSKICIDAAELGVNILVEKPLALTVEEGMEVKKAVESNGVKLCVVHNYKFMDSIMKAKSMYDSGQLGKLLSIHTIAHGISPPAWNTWRMNQDESGSFVLQWNHPIYLQTWFGGNPKSVFAIGRSIIPSYPQIMDVKALINFGDCTGFLELSNFCSSSQFLIDVTGTGSSVSVKLPVKLRVVGPSTAIDVVEEAINSMWDVGKLFRIYLSDKKRPYQRFTSGSHFRLIEQFLKSIKDNVPVPATIDEGILSIRIAKAIDESIQCGKEIRL